MSNSLWPHGLQHSSLLSITNSRSLLKLMSMELVMPSNQLILCHPLLLSSIFYSIKVFSNESVLHIRWPKYWSFSISPSNEYSGLISCRIDWFDLAVQWTLKRLLQHSLKASTLQCSAFFMVQCSYPYMTRVLLTTSNLSHAPDALRPWRPKDETLPWTILTVDNDRLSNDCALETLRIHQIITECFLCTFLSQTLYVWASVCSP